MSTELIIIIFCVVTWFILHFEAYPGSDFAEWGSKKFGYGRFINIIALVCFTPAILTMIYWIYKLYQQSL